MRTEIKINLGLANNTVTFDGLVNKIAEQKGHLNALGIYKAKLVNGQYNGINEPTALMYGNTLYQYSYIVKMIENLCDVFTQDCIAVKINGQGLLIYNPNFKGEKSSFDELFFINE